MKRIDESMQRILIILENEELSRAYSLILKTPLNSVEVVRTFPEALKMVQRTRPSVILCDPFPKDEERAGLEFINRVHEEDVKTKVLVLSERYNEDLIAQAFRAGASGYILYEKGIEEVLKAVKDVAGNGAPMSKEVAACLVTSYQVSRDNPLSRREREVLREISTGKTYHYIAQELHVSVDTIRTHVQHIFDKLEVNNKSEAVIKARSQRLV